MLINCSHFWLIFCEKNVCKGKCDSLVGLLSELNETTCGLTISSSFIGHSKKATTLWRKHSFKWTDFSMNNKNEVLFRLRLILGALLKTAQL